MPDTLKEQVFKHLSHLAAVANLSPENRLAYDRAVDRYNVDRLVEKETIREAKEEGIKEVARKFKKDGFPADVIARNTGLSIQEIEQL